MVEAKATAKHVRGSPSKARLVIDLIRGKRAAEALSIPTRTIASNAGAYSEADFRDTVRRMVGYGAAVTEAQIEPLVGYLVETYGR